MTWKKVQGTWNIWHVKSHFVLLAATKLLYKCYCPSVCLSRHFHYVPVIVSSWNFVELLPLTKVMSVQKVNGQGTGVKNLPQFGCFHTITLVWIHRWLHSGAQTLKWHKRSMEEVPYCFWRSSVKFQGHTGVTGWEIDLIDLSKIKTF